MAGFTLIEVLIAMVIFTIGILGVMVMQSSSINGNAHARRLSEATTWGADQVEQLMRRPYSDLLLQDIDGDGSNGLDHSQCCQDGKDPQGNGVPGCTDKADQCQVQGDYDIYWNMADNQPITNLKQIRVIVINSSLPAPIKLDFFKTNDF